MSRPCCAKSSGAPRALTGARYGAITTVGNAGELQDFFTSGLGAGPSTSRWWGWADGPRFFEHLRDLEIPLRLTDFAGYLRSFGYTPFPVLYQSVQATPLSHRGQRLGAFCLGDKEGGGEFTSEDEELAGAVRLPGRRRRSPTPRAHRAEQRTRARLEALVDTSPVGVTMFDVSTGHLMSSNREAERIAGEPAHAGRAHGATRAEGTVPTRGRRARGHPSKSSGWYGS